MKRFLTVLVLAVLALGFAACNKAEGGLKWGETNYFKDSFLKKYEPVVMAKTLNFGLNEDGCDLSDTEFSFDVYERTPSGEMVKAQEVVLYKNGTPCPNNVLKVKGGEGKVVVGVEFTPDAAEGYHTLFLKAKSLNGLDRIEYTSLGDGFVARKQNVMNPANELVMWILIVLASAYAAWVILLRPIFCPHVKFSKVDIYYPGTAGEVTVRTNGYCSLILSNKPIKQSWLKKLFFVQDQVEVNEAWSSQVRIESGKGRNVKVYTVLDVDPSPLDMPERRERFHVINEDNQRIGVETW